MNWFGRAQKQRIPSSSYAYWISSTARVTSLSGIGPDVMTLPPDVSRISWPQRLYARAMPACSSGSMPSSHMSYSGP